MTGTPLTVVGLMPQLARLLEVYKRPEQYPADSESLARLFFDVLHGLSLEQVTQAVAAYRRSPAQWFPKPGQLRALALEQPGAPGAATPRTLEQQYWAWERTGWTAGDGGAFVPCPVCGSHVDLTGRSRVLHDHQRHYEAGIGYVGPRTGPMEKGAMAPATGPRPDHRTAAAGDREAA